MPFRPQQNIGGATPRLFHPMYAFVAGRAVALHYSPFPSSPSATQSAATSPICSPKAAGTISHAFNVCGKASRSMTLRMGRSKLWPMRQANPPAQYAAGSTHRAAWPAPGPAALQSGAKCQARPHLPLAPQYPRRARSTRRRSPAALQYAQASALLRLFHHADRELGNATTTGPTFNRSRLVVADWTRGAKPNVTYLPCITICPQVQTAGGNDACAQAGAQGKKQHVVDTHARTKAISATAPALASFSTRQVV